MSVGRLVGPGKIIKLHSNREEKLKNLILRYDLSHTSQVDESTPAFLEKNVLLPDTLRGFEKDALRRLSSKSLPEGYIATLLKQDHFK